MGGVPHFQGNRVQIGWILRSLTHSGLLLCCTMRRSMGKTQLIVVGCVLDQSVAHAVMDAADLGYLVTLVPGAVLYRLCRAVPCCAILCHAMTCLAGPTLRRGVP